MQIIPKHKLILHGLYDQVFFVAKYVGVVKTPEYMYRLFATVTIKKNI